jgi:hypothetical protein
MQTKQPSTYQLLSIYPHIGGGEAGEVAGEVAGEDLAGDAVVGEAVGVGEEGGVPR